MPENPQTPPPFQPVKPWIRDMVTEKPVVKPVVETKPLETKPVAPILEEKKVEPIIEELKKEVVAPTPAAVTPAAPIVDTPAPAATSAPVVTPAAAAPVSPLK